ncbi:MAG: hypothetical protein IIA09_15760 [Proteobacteria bacterium]|nr:hypothetical protein [Pseudomonadota bacterium]
MGEVAGKDFIAETVIILNKTDKELEDERRTISRSMPVIFDYDSSIVDSAFKQLRGFIRRASRLRDSLIGDSPADLGVYAEALALSFPLISSVALRETYFADSLQTVYKNLKVILDEEIYFTGVLSSLEAMGDETFRPVIVRLGGRETILPRSQTLDLNRAREALLDRLNILARESSINVELHYEIGRHFIYSNLRLATVDMQRRELEAIFTATRGGPWR